MKRKAVWFAAGSIGTCLATTIAGVAVISSEDPGRRRVGETLLSPASATQPGLHDFIGIGFAFVFNVLVIATMCWLTLTLLELMLKAAWKVRRRSS